MSMLKTAVPTTIGSGSFIVGSARAINSDYTFSLKILEDDLISQGYDIASDEEFESISRDLVGSYIPLKLENPLIDVYRENDGSLDKDKLKKGCEEVMGRQTIKFSSSGVFLRSVKILCTNNYSVMDYSREVYGEENVLSMSTPTNGDTMKAWESELNTFKGLESKTNDTARTTRSTENTNDKQSFERFKSKCQDEGKFLYRRIYLFSENKNYWSGIFDRLCVKKKASLNSIIYY